MFPRYLSLALVHPPQPRKPPPLKEILETFSIGDLSPIRRHRWRWTEYEVFPNYFHHFMGPLKNGSIAALCWVRDHRDEIIWWMIVSLISDSRSQARYRQEISSVLCCNQVTCLWLRVNGDSLILFGGLRGSAQRFRGCQGNKKNGRGREALYEAGSLFSTKVNTPDRSLPWPRNESVGQKVDKW